MLILTYLFPTFYVLFIFTSSSLMTLMIPLPIIYIFGDWILHNKPDKRRSRNKWYCAEILRRLYTIFSGNPLKRLLFLLSKKASVFRHAGFH